MQKNKIMKLRQILLISFSILFFLCVINKFQMKQAKAEESSVYKMFLSLIINWVDFGEILPTPTLIQTKISTYTSTWTSTATSTQIPTQTGSPIATQVPIQTNTPTITRIPTQIPTSTDTRTPTQTPTLPYTKTPTQTTTPTLTKTPTQTSMPTFTRTPTVTSTNTPTTIPTFSWSQECIDCPRYYNHNELNERRFAINANGDRFLVFGGDHLYFSRFDGVQWQIETADPSPQVGTQAAVAVDPNGLPRVFYYDYLNNAMKYAAWDGARWNIQIIDSAGEPNPDVNNSYLSLAIDSFGISHVAYWDFTSKRLNYAKQVDGSWVIHKIEQDIDVSSVSIACDNNGNAYVSYLVSYYLLKFASWTGQSWAMDFVANDVLGGPISIVISDDGTKYISYSTIDELMLAKKDGAIWETQPIYSKGTQVSLVVDGSEMLHISFLDTIQQCLIYGYLNNSNWEFRAVTCNFDFEAYPSLALDPLGNPEINFWDPAESHLSHARWIQDHWDLQAVDEGSFFAIAESLGLIKMVILN